MTAEEAIEYLKITKLAAESGSVGEIQKDMCNTAIEALEKQIPYKPKTKKLFFGVGKCKCGVEFLDKETKYCGNCGQKLNWKDRSEEE